MPRTFRMVGLWDDLKIDLSPIPVKEVTNLCLEYTFLAECFVFRSGNPGMYLLCRINHAHIYSWMHANAREKERSGVRVQMESETGERHTPHGRVKTTCLARKYRSCQRFAPCKTDFEKSTTVLQSKKSIDKIQWFLGNLIPSSFHWNRTTECGMV